MVIRRSLVLAAGGVACALLASCGDNSRATTLSSPTPTRSAVHTFDPPEGIGRQIEYDIEATERLRRDVDARYGEPATTEWRTHITGIFARDPKPESIVVLTDLTRDKSGLAVSRKICEAVADVARAGTVFIIGLSDPNDYWWCNKNFSEELRLFGQVAFPD